MHLTIWENVFSLQLLFGWSLGFAFLKWFVKLEKTLLKTILNYSNQMEKNWQRSAKVFNHKQEIDDGPVYPSTCIIQNKNSICFGSTGRTSSTARRAQKGHKKTSPSRAWMPARNSLGGYWASHPEKCLKPSPVKRTLEHLEITDNDGVTTTYFLFLTHNWQVHWVIRLLVLDSKIRSLTSN
jgi:hypothetical protein